MIRTWLTFWNSVVFGLALTLIGVVIYITTRTSLYRAVDDDLDARANFLEHLWAQPNRGRPMDDHPPGGPDERRPPPTQIGGGAHPSISSSGMDGRKTVGPGYLVRQGEQRLSKDMRDRWLTGRSKDVNGGTRGRPGPMGGPPHGPHHGGPGDDIDGGPGGGPRGAAMFLALARGLDPIEAERIEFRMRLAPPRVFPFHRHEDDPPQDSPYDETLLKASQKGRRGMTTGELDGHPIRILSLPLHDNSGKLVGAVQFAASLVESDASLARLKLTLLGLLPLALLATSLLGRWLTHRALRPVREIAETAERIEATDLSGRLAVRGNDEFALLSSRFNSMLARIEGAFHRLERTNEAQRRFIADASHELKTPLTTVKGRVGVALAKPQTPEKYENHLRSIGRAADSMGAIIQDLLLLAQSDEDRLPLRLESVPLVRLVSEAVAVASGGQTGRVATSIPEGLAVSVDPSLFQRVLINLLSNAIRHTDPEKSVCIRAEAMPDRILIEVADEGDGIPAEHVPLIFERFHRVNSARDRESGGTGLGLAIVKSIVEAHGGSVRMASALQIGTTVTIELPALPRVGNDVRA